MTNDATFEKIEAWLARKLTAAEAQAFETEMASDPALAAEVKRHQQAQEAIGRLTEQALQKDLALWRTSMDQLPEPPVDGHPEKRPSTHLRWLLGGMVLLFLLGFVWWYRTSQNNQPVNAPLPENSTPQSGNNSPIANTPPDKPNTQEIKPLQDQENYNKALIASAKTNLRDFRGAILQQYGQTMGDEEEENPLFTAGVEAFKKKDLKTAKNNLLQIKKADPFFPSAQEILAYIYLQEQNYSRAIQCYESYASQSAEPVTDWRLLQFYLLDYPNHKTAFSIKLKEVLDGKNQHQYQKEAIKLQKSIKELDIR
ncbi:MAG: hypothetical protein JNN28_01360 [Saprospiraceae bacterium]|nr:hypothetical protein [Saprospiraceae bacterium]